jgi:hypothetical protein
MADITNVLNSWLGSEQIGREIDGLDYTVWEKENKYVQSLCYSSL